MFQANSAPLGMESGRNVVYHVNDEEKHSGYPKAKREFVLEGDFECTQKLQWFGKNGDCARGSAIQGGLCSVHNNSYAKLYRNLKTACGQNDPRLFDMFRSLGLVSREEYDRDIHRERDEIARLRAEMAEMRRIMGAKAPVVDVEKERLRVEEEKKRTIAHAKEAEELRVKKAEFEAIAKAHAEASRAKEAERDAQQAQAQRENDARLAKIEENLRKHGKQLNTVQNDLVVIKDDVQQTNKTLNNAMEYVQKQLEMPKVVVMNVNFGAKLSAEDAMAQKLIRDEIKKKLALSDPVADVKS